MKVTVETGCRLHLGFTNLSEDMGRRFGSIGLAVDQPVTVVDVGDNDITQVVARRSQRVGDLINRFCEHYGIEPCVSVSVRESIPEHVGLGSGTQLALAVGLGLAKVAGIDASVRDLAAVMARGARSGIGTSCFEWGGLTIDAGHRNDARGLSVPPTLVWHHEIPDDWRFVVAIPDAIRGLSGHAEEAAFKALPPSVRISHEICRLVQLRLMPAIVEHDIESFGDAMTAIDEKTGSYFSSAGRRDDSGVPGTWGLESMTAAGALGVGQSSWGPAVYGLTTETDAARVAEKVRARMRERGVGCRVFVGRGRNEGARVMVAVEDLVKSRPESLAGGPWPYHTVSQAPPCVLPWSSL